MGVEAAVHIYNKTPHKSLNSETPINKLTPKVKTHLEQIRRFGCVAYAKIPITERKFSERAIKAIMVGYSQTGYVLWHPSTGKFLHSRHVKCNEKLVYKDIYKQKPQQNDKSEETEESKDPEKEIVPVHSEEKVNQRKNKQKRNKKMQGQRRENQKTKNQITQKQRNATNPEEIRKQWKTEENIWQSEEPKRQNN